VQQGPFEGRLYVPWLMRVIAPLQALHKPFRRRCPTGACCAGGQDGCASNQCGTKTCCGITPDCSNLSNIRVQGRECSASCGAAGADPFYQPANYNTYSSYVYPTCPARRRSRRLQ
jgi:hypothetical protein